MSSELGIEDLHGDLDPHLLMLGTEHCAHGAYADRRQPRTRTQLRRDGERAPLSGHESSVTRGRASGSSLVLLIRSRI